MVHAGDLGEGFLEGGSKAVVPDMVGGSQVVFLLVKDGRLKFQILEGLDFLLLIECQTRIKFPVLDNIERGLDKVKLTER